MASDPPQRVKNCPICGLAMLASKSQEDAETYDIFRCLTCQSVVSLTPAPRTLRATSGAPDQE